METLTIELEKLGRPTWSAEEAANVALVADFVRLLMNEHDFDAVRNRFGTSAYTQHNHGIADGLEYIANWNAAMFDPDDMSEAFSAKMEKRAADFPDLFPTSEGL